jgi:hypothetical protein
MFRRRRPARLEPPPIGQAAGGSAPAAEIPTVWVAADGPYQLALRTTWDDPASWGLLLVDIARHAAKAYQRDGRDGDATLHRIREAFDAEWFHPTDEPKDLTDER